MDTQHYWIVGGEYRSFEFNAMIEGTEQLIGPIDDRDQAEVLWRQVSERHKSNATMRFTIASSR